MNEKRKRVLAGCLLVGAGIVWTPELLSAGQAAKPPPKVDLPANADWAGTTNALATGAIARPSSMAPAEEVLGSPTRRRTGSRVGAGEGLLESLEHSLEVARNAWRERAPIDLEALARTWRREVDLSAPRKEVRE